jgi:hypothetical protein
VGAVRAKTLKDWQTGNVGHAARRFRVIGTVEIGSKAFEITGLNIGC